MPTLLSALLALTFAVTAVAADPPDSVQPPSGEIDLLGDGTLDGWVHYLEDAALPVDAVWTLENGVLSCTGRPTGYLQTKRWYRDYEVELEWRWDPATGGGNCGVLVHATAPQVFYAWPRSLEVQLQHGSAGDFWVIGAGVDVRVENEKDRRMARRPGDAHSHRRIRRLESAGTPERELGAWNTMRIRAAGDRVQVWVNEVLVNDGTDCTVDEGAIALQSEGKPIQFRKIMLRPTDTRPRVLMLGDSISMGYHKAVVAELGEDAIVVRPDDNCAGTTKGVRRIDDWLSIEGGGFDLIHFNFGLHDLKRVESPGGNRNSNDPNDPHQANLETYGQNLRELVRKLEATGATLVFATTTPVPEGGVRPYRDPADVERYNAVARDIMASRGIAIDDLAAFATPRLAEIQKPVDVHFTKEGSAILGAEVARVIREALQLDTE